MGKTGFHYGWIYNNDNASGKFKFNVTEKGGFIATQSRVYCKMNLTFLSKSVLKNFEVTLRIPLGPEYRILVQASATMPVFEFSLSEHNFGPCIIQKSERLFNKFNLTFFNKDEQDLA
ncbi:hypothetical protein C0J52_12914 [Blattella germanica]|nr:hypothetical protein C0J52_12914 [Blattella germanica]